MCHQTSVTQFVRYVAIGIIVLAVDLSVLWALLNRGLGRDEAITVAILAAMATQFVLNRLYNFRTSNVPVWQQLPGYVIVTAANIFATIAVVRIISATLAVPVMLAKVLSLPITTPPTFLAHAHLTFGRGSQKLARFVIARLSPVFHR